MNGWRFALATLAMSPFAPVWNGLVHVLRLADAETELQLLMCPANPKQSADHGAFFGLLVDLNQFLLYPIPGRWYWPGSVAALLGSAVTACWHIGCIGRVRRQKRRQYKFSPTALGVLNDS